jgi:multisubunit Na+/H+ antiporter MnhC subunit
LTELWQIYVAGSAVLALVGIYSVAARRNMIRSIIGVEIITAAVNLNFIALGSRVGQVDTLAQSIVFTSIVIGASIAAVALSIVINAYRHYGTLDLKKLSRLRW